MSNAEKPGRRATDMGASYLSGQASVKDDLQAIYSLNREIGAAVFTVLKHLETLKGTLTEEVPESYAHISDQLDRVSHSIEQLKKEHLAISERLEALDDLRQSAEDMGEFHKELEDIEARRQEHLDRVIKIVYANNGYDEKGNKIPEAIMRFDRWSKIIHNSFWSFITTLIMTGVFYLVVKGREEVSAEKTKATIELIEKTKELLNKQDQEKAPEVRKTSGNR